MRTFFAACRCLVLAGLAFIFTHSSAPAAERPNIVMIISDDQAWSDYSFMGHPHIRTPNIDRLASQSLTFRRGYDTSSLCCPSLVSMITGLYPHQHRITSNDPPLPVGKRGPAANQDAGYRALRQQMIGFIDEVPTLPKILAQQGYLSLQTGKWWQGNYSHGGFTHGMTKGDPDANGRHGDVGLTIGRKTMQPIYDFIETAQKEQKPFFIWYAPMMPHDPHTPPARLFEKYKDKTTSTNVANYWAMVEWFDETCGDLLGHLDKKGLAENTIVLYLSDNGWIQDPNAKRYAPKSKQSQYDGGLRTPIMLRWPAKVKPQQSDALASAIDFMPTLLSVLGVPKTKDMQGINLLDDRAVKARETIYGECFTHNAVDIQKPATSLRWRWVIEGDWKLILPSAANEPDAKPELFQLKQDPSEEKNLATEQAGKVAALTKKLDAWWAAKP